jgi:hypothetical protein
MAQLPYLLYDQRPPMSSESFKALSLSMLNNKDSELLQSLCLDPDPNNAGEKGPSYAESAPKTGCSFIDAFREWERTLRLSLAKQRAAKMQNSSITTIEPPFFPVDANQAAAKVVASDISPLEGEIMIDKARWNAIDALAGNDYFHRNSVFAYYLKLLLLERRLSFNAEKGFAEYKSLYASIVEKGKSLAEKTLGEPA